MCGICGFVSKNELDFQKINLITKSITHRGPDAEGIWNNQNISLGHLRLSIIDLSPLGNQPMISNDGNLILVFNGEIYNYLTIKNKLQQKGYQFKSTSDTEVVLYAYKEWGTQSFTMFNGMFALAIYDKLKQHVLLARDHAGIKPVYYSTANNNFLFSSEIRGFKAFDPNWPEDKNWPVYFLSFGFIPYPYSTLKDVFILPKGSYLIYDLNHENSAPEIKPFHTFSYSNLIVNEKEALEKVRTTVLDAVNRHMIADAPLGIFLSGGIDSSLCALIADHLGHENLNTLSITFNEATFNEEPYQNIVLDKMRPHNHQSYKVSGSMFMENLNDVFAAMDQPSWDGVNTYFISKCAHDAGLKAVLSGIGGDELFGGYPSFQRIHLLNKLSKIPGFLKTWAGYFSNETVKRLAYLNYPGNYNEYLFLRGGFSPEVIHQLTGVSLKDIHRTLAGLVLPDYPQQRNGNLAAYLEANVYMENQLLKDSDFMSMWHSLEVRVPFLDKELMELMCSIAPEIKYNFSQPKYLLTKAFADILPNDIVFRVKQGFTFPFNIWLKENISHFKQYLPQSALVNKNIELFLTGKIHWSRIWALIILQKHTT